MISIDETSEVYQQLLSILEEMPTIDLREESDKWVDMYVNHMGCLYQLSVDRPGDDKITLKLIMHSPNGTRDMIGMANKLYPTNDDVCMGISAKWDDEWIIYYNKKEI